MNRPRFEGEPVSFAMHPGLFVILCAGGALVWVFIFHGLATLCRWAAPWIQRLIFS